MAAQGSGCRDKNSLGLQTNGHFFFANYSDRTLYCLIGTTNQTCTDAFRTRHSSQKPGPRCCPTQLPHTIAPHKFPPHSCPGQLPPHKLPPHNCATQKLYSRRAKPSAHPSQTSLFPQTHSFFGALEQVATQRNYFYLYIYLFFSSLHVQSRDGERPFCVRVFCVAELALSHRP